MTNNQIIEWCLSEKQQLKGNNSKGSLRRVEMLYKIQDRAERCVDCNTKARWGVV